MANPPLISPEPASLPCSPALVREELERLLASDQFRNSKRSSSLLSYLVEETLAGRRDQLKERVVGASVFGREHDYDTAEDPIVRNAAVEVRKRLAQYYIDSGSTATVRIELHAGTYVPEFRYATAVEAVTPGKTQTLLLLPFITIGRWKLLLVAGAVALLLLAGSIAWYRYAVPVKSASIVAATPGATPTATINGEAVRILAGNTKPGPYVDRFGNQWLSDRYFTGGDARPGVTSFFFPPPDPEIFRNMRAGVFSYDIPLKPGQIYEMRLSFAEPVFRYGNAATGDGEGERYFQVYANDVLLLNYFDIISDAGFASTTVRAFKDIAATADGKLHLRFVRQQSDPLINGIELLPSTPHHMLPIRIHAGQYDYQDQAGNRWTPDNFFIGGGLFDARVPALGTDDPDLFKVERVGNFHYALPVPPGRYRLTLYFAETWFHNPGNRVFDVSCNGQMLLHHLDILREVGFSHLYQKTFHGLEPNGQGKLMLEFNPVVNYASLRALEVEDEGR